MSISKTESKPAVRSTLMSTLWHVVSTVVTVCLLVWWVPRFSANDSRNPYPNRPIEIIVPYPAGGGSDTFVRTLQNGFVKDNLLNQPLVVVNVAGGGGTIGSRDVKDAKPDGYRILCHHNAIISAKLSETVAYGPEAFEPIALTGTMTMVIIVREDARFADLKELLAEAKRTPKTVTFGANQGAPAYFTVLQLEKCAPGAAFSIVSADGGADRYSRILGGHLDAGIFSLSEYLDFRSAAGTPPDENIRAIAVLSRIRHAAIPDVPTSVEQGLPVLLSNANYWWAPKGTPKKVIDVLASALEKAMQNKTVRTELTRLRVDLKFARGEPFRRVLQETIDSFDAAVANRQKNLPDFTTWVGWTVVGLIAWMLADAWINRGASTTDNENVLPGLPGSSGNFVRRPLTAAVCFVVLLCYVYTLSRHWLPFAVATAVMVLVVGGLMTKWRRQHWVMLLQLAVLTGLGTTYIFTEIFTTPLP